MRRLKGVLKDDVLSSFRTFARKEIFSGYDFDFEACFRRSCKYARYPHILMDAKNTTQPLEQDLYEELRTLCRAEALKLQKQHTLMEVKKASVDAILSAFSKTSPVSFTYMLYANYVASLIVLLPTTNQYVRFNNSFAKILSDGWSEEMSRTIQDLLDLSARLGKVKCWNNSR